MPRITLFSAAFLASLFLCFPTQASYQVVIPTAVKALFDAVSFGASANQFAQNNGIDNGDASYAWLPAGAWSLEGIAALSSLISLFPPIDRSRDNVKFRALLGVSLITNIGALALNAASLERLHHYNKNTTALPSENSVTQMTNANTLAVSTNAASIVVGLLIFTLPSIWEPNKVTTSNV